MSLPNKITTFFKKKHELFKKPLEKIINTMLNKCRYINGESLERHNWGGSPIKLNFIPKNINSTSFESDLLKALELNPDEKSIIELLWGDIQLGKRVHACIIMWVSVYILKRPVLYIFRNLSIDQKQLQDDIVGTENYNFNIQFIKNLFEEFNNELQECFEEKNVEYWKDYKLPELKDINSIDKLSNKEAINSNDIFCCLMNHAQLEKINKKFSEYIFYNEELVNITVLTDEGDLMTPSSSNDMSNDNDIKDSTLCEILLAKIYKKVKYSLHITGTAHSLLYNITTRLSDNEFIQNKISKVHKMKRSSDYFGLFNNSITFNTEEETQDNGQLIKKQVINSWWDYDKYDIIKDYNINIKKIIDTIIKRKNVKYNSLLISEEKIRINQFCLVDIILKDFPDLFIVIYHGNCLRLYLSKEYETEIKCWSKWDAKKSSTSQRLWQDGGVYGSSIDTERSNQLPNNYCYFDINTKILNIKFIYKLLRILFEKSEIKIKNKTAITITGKYGERGYSFTSDDYDNYSFHLTDQYFVSHASFNCTDISQRLRLQGKYNDNELKNGEMKLTLWTTIELQNVIQHFYVKFIKEIEKFIMECDTWEDIISLLEGIIDTGNGNMQLGFKTNMRHIDVAKKRKNLQSHKHFEKKNNGYRLFLTEKMKDYEIAEWCKQSNLPEYVCVNEINEMEKDMFIQTYGNQWDIKTFYGLTIDELNEKFTKIGKKEHKSTLDNSGRHVCCIANESLKMWDYDELYNKLKNYGVNSTHGFQNGLKSNNTYATRSWVGYTKQGEIRYILKLAYKGEKKKLPIPTNNYIKKTPYIENDDTVIYSKLKDKYKQKTNHGYTNEDGDNFIEDGGFPDKYYWKTPDGWLYLFDKDKPEIYSINIIVPPIIPVVNQPTSPKINNDVLLFTNMCFKKTDKTNLRVGITKIYTIYKTWCEVNKTTCLKSLQKLKEELEKLNYKYEESKGVDIHNKPGKRGYNIMVGL